MVSRWMNTTQCIRSSVLTWLITLTWSVVCWSELKMPVWWGTCEYVPWPGQVLFLATCISRAPHFILSLAFFFFYGKEMLLALGIWLCFPGGSDGKESACNAGDPDSIPGSGRSPVEGNGYPLQYSCLDNSWISSFPRNLAGCSYGVAKSRTWLSDKKN